MADAQKFEDTFVIDTVDNSKYDRVSRIFGNSADHSVALTLDINHELFPVSVQDNLNLVLADSLSLNQDGVKEEKGWRETAKGEASLADMYEYVMHGRIYKFEDGGEGGNV